MTKLDEHKFCIRHYYNLYETFIFYIPLVGSSFFFIYFYADSGLQQFSFMYKKMPNLIQNWRRENSLTGKYEKWLMLSRRFLFRFFVYLTLILSIFSSFSLFPFFRKIKIPISLSKFMDSSWNCLTYEITISVKI